MLPKAKHSVLNTAAGLSNTPAGLSHSSVELAHTCAGLAHSYARSAIRLISGFRREVDENCALLAYLDHYSLRGKPKGHSFQG